MAEESSGQQVGLWMRVVTVLQNLLGRQQGQQQLEQFQRSDRQLADGFDRGADDPDNRRAQQAPRTTDYNYDVVQQARVRVQEQGQQSTGQDTSASQPRPASSQDASALLRAQMDAFQQQIQAEQRRQQSRGQGRGL